MNIRLAVAGAAVAVLALAGCSSSSDDAESSPSPSMSESAGMETGTIVDVAAGNPEFSTLVAAVGAADLADTLSSDGPFTVFAPTNDAFAKLGQDTIDTLLKPENKEALAGILTYHVLDEKVTSDEVAPGTVATLNGADLTISVDSAGMVMVNDAKVEQVDQMASNGVIHVIDTVLLPPDFDSASLQ